MPCPFAFVVGRRSQALNGRHDGGRWAARDVAGSDGRPGGVFAREDGGGRATFVRTHAATNHPRGPRFVDVPDREGVAPGQANLNHGGGGARWGEQGKLNGFPIVQVNDGRVLHEVGGRVTNQVRDIEAQIFVSGEGDGLKFPTDPCGWTDLEVVRRGTFLTVGWREAARQRCAAHQQHEDEGVRHATRDHVSPWRLSFSSLFTLRTGSAPSQGCIDSFMMEQDDIQP